VFYFKTIANFVFLEEIPCGSLKYIAYHSASEGAGRVHAIELIWEIRTHSIRSSDSNNQFPCLVVMEAEQWFNEKQKQ